MFDNIRITGVDIVTKGRQISLIKIMIVQILSCRQPILKISINRKICISKWSNFVTLVSLSDYIFL